ncbi:hypothetical protein [Nonomuraea sp. KM88]
MIRRLADTIMAGRRAHGREELNRRPGIVRVPDLIRQVTSTRS